MSDDLIRWRQDGERNGWQMPTAPRWKRLPIIRRIRAAHHAARVWRHDAAWSAFGLVPTGYDEWVIFGMAMGMERDAPR